MTLSDCTGSVRLHPHSLKDFETNNDPAWFKPRETIYDYEVRRPFREWITGRRSGLEWGYATNRKPNGHDQKGGGFGRKPESAHS